MKREECKAAGSAPFPFARMARKPDALDRLDLRFRWGRFGVRVLRCHLTSFPPGHVIGFHRHSEFEFHFVAGGKGTVAFEDGTEHALQEGMFYLTGPDVLHRQKSDPSDPMYELCLHCDIAALSDEPAADGWGEALEAGEAEACVRLLREMPYTPATDRHNAMAAFLDAYRAWEEQPIGVYTVLKQAIIQIVLRAARVHAIDGNKDPIPERDMKNHRFHLATQFIEDNVSRPLTLEEVAEKVQVSPRQLQRIFRSEGNATFQEWKERVRLQRICVELARTERPVEAIAQENGFANVNYLYPVFKQAYGMTPAAYRRRYGDRR